eukprot:TRINITY_DN48388_c0_g1_i1.p1 TRINITY_DN48388_c0_g1~~TRINITY_DN48388_c0_g1_i1.p1  ORF type:complete len:668 (-),score=145.31 TRINITY_DN48388_c0_g1_i1:34-1803(-)
MPDAFRPPKDLLAPAGSARLRLDHGLHDAEGTMWEGLGFWNTAEAENILEGTVIDYAAMQKLWAPMPSPPPRESFVRSRQLRSSVLPVDVSRQAEIAVKGAKLTPDLVKLALTEDMLALSSEQAHVLNAVLAPMAQEASGLLRGVVEQRGAEFLSSSEAVLWTISCIPAAELRAQLVAEQHDLEANVGGVRDAVATVESVTRMLRESKSMRSLLQMILIARNVLGQEARAGFQARSFSNISSQRLNRPTPTSFDPDTGEVIPAPSHWMNLNNPSILNLVAQMIESTHEKRCRLRFLRMFALGRSSAFAGLNDDHVLQNIWSYLDDLGESPRDVLPLLRTCSQSICDQDMLDYISRQGRQYELMVPLLESLEHSVTVADIESLFVDQLQSMRMRYSAAQTVCENSAKELVRLAGTLCKLGGECPARSRDVFDGAGAVLRSLKHLGHQLAEALSAVQVKRAAEAAANRTESGRPTTRWPQVDTSYMLWYARDPDMIRRLKQASVSMVEAASQEQALLPQRLAAQAHTEAVQPQEAVEGTVQVPSVPIDLMHSGTDGVYVRDEVTGLWGRRQDGVQGTGGSGLGLGGPRVDP